MEYHLTMKDVKKYEILKQVLDKKIKGKEATVLWGYHPVHISRLKKKVAISGGTFKFLMQYSDNSKDKN